MGDFREKRRFSKRDSEKFGRRNFGRSERESEDRFGKSGFERPNSMPQRRMFAANCDKCGNRCELPFKPTSGKPVYCSACFKKNEYLDSKDKPKSSSRELEEINSKLDKIMRALNIR